MASSGTCSSRSNWWGSIFTPEKNDFKMVDGIQLRRLGRNDTNWCWPAFSTAGCFGDKFRLLLRGGWSFGCFISTSTSQCWNQVKASDVCKDWSPTVNTHHRRVGMKSHEHVQRRLKILIYQNELSVSIYILSPGWSELIIKAMAAVQQWLILDLIFGTHDVLSMRRSDALCRCCRASKYRISNMQACVEFDWKLCYEAVSRWHGNLKRPEKLSSWPSKLAGRGRLRALYW